MRHFIQTTTFLVLISFLSTAKCDIEISTHQLSMKLNDSRSFNVTVTNFQKTDVEVLFKPEYNYLINVDPPVIVLNSTNSEHVITVYGVGIGKSMLTAQASQDVNVKKVFLTATIYRSKFIDVLSLVVGWAYFVAWSVSFYPQIVTNFKRKSVVGLDFDYLSLNLVGYISYTLFTIGVYYVPDIINEYMHRYPTSLIPVTSNDIAFNIHGTIAVLVTVFQCFIYTRGNQKISVTAIVILAGIGIAYFVSFLMVQFSHIHWLDFLYFCSYIKLLITLLKYLPQAYLNFKRKSTDGWSIGGVFLDLLGGLFSVLQMLLDSYNYDDWISVFGNLSKFGLGFFSILFQFIFIAQHYVMYKPSKQRALLATHSYS